MGERQAKGNEKNQCLKGWETLVILYKKVYATSLYNIIEDRMASKQLTQTYLIYQNLHLLVSGSY